MRLLAILTGAEGTAACLDAAAVLARATGAADIEALNVEVDPERIIAASEEINFQRLREHDEGTARQRSDATHTAYAAWFAHAADDVPPVKWKSIVGAEEDVVTREASRADILVLVLAREHNMDGTDAFDASVYRSGKPTLLVPLDWRAGERRSFDHIVVALSDSEIAEHAIVGAGSVLRAATKVTALRIGDDSDPAMKMIDALRGVGVEPVLHVVPREGADLGAQIADVAQKLGADLLVAGAYRHGQLVEWLVGGTTRHLLAAAKLPLLLAH